MSKNQKNTHTQTHTLSPLHKSFANGTSFAEASATDAGTLQTECCPGEFLFTPLRICARSDETTLYEQINARNII